MNLEIVFFQGDMSEFMEIYKFAKNRVHHFFIFHIYKITKSKFDQTFLKILNNFTSQPSFLIPSSVMSGITVSKSVFSSSCEADVITPNGTRVVFLCSRTSGRYMSSSSSVPKFEFASWIGAQTVAGKTGSGEGWMSRNSGGGGFLGDGRTVSIMSGDAAAKVAWFCSGAWFDALEELEVGEVPMEGRVVGVLELVVGMRIGSAGGGWWGE